MILLVDTTQTDFIDFTHQSKQQLLCLPLNKPMASAKIIVRQGAGVSSDVLYIII